MFPNYSFLYHEFTFLFHNTNSSNSCSTLSFFPCLHGITSLSTRKDCPMHNLACKLATWLYSHSSIHSKPSLEVYTYGFELLLSSILGCVFIFLISLLLNQPKSAAFFLLVFCPLRAYSGGYHSSTLRHCLFSSTFVYFIVVTLSIYLSCILPVHFSLLFSVLASFLIYMYAPVIHPNHPVSHQRYARGKLISCYLAFSMLLLLCLLNLFHVQATTVFLISLSELAVAILMIIPRFFSRR